MSELPIIKLETVFLRTARPCTGGELKDVEGLLAQPSLGTAIDFVLSRADTAASRAGLTADQIGLGVLAKPGRGDLVAFGRDLKLVRT